MNGPFQMTHPEQDPLSRDRHVENALDRANRLSTPRPHEQYTAAWWIEANRVGDLTALAALDLARSRRS
jgi:hypothetical protein